MVSFKPNFLILAIATIGAIVPKVSAGELKVDIETHDNDPEPGRPKHPLFACEIKSRACRSPSHYTGVVFDPIKLQLGVCYDPSVWKDFYNYVSLSSKRGQFISTYYVSCPEKDEECKQKCKEMSADEIRNVVENDINEQTSCVASVRCWDIQNVNKHCYQKN